MHTLQIFLPPVIEFMLKGGLLFIIFALTLNQSYFFKRITPKLSLTSYKRLVRKKCNIYCIEMHNNLFFRIYFKCKNSKYIFDIQKENMTYIQKCILKSKFFILAFNKLYGMGIVEDKDVSNAKTTAMLVRIIDSNNLKNDYKEFEFIEI